MAQNTARCCGPAMNVRITRHPRYAISQRKRRMIEITLMPLMSIVPVLTLRFAMKVPVL